MKNRKNNKVLPITIFLLLIFSLNFFIVQAENIVINYDGALINIKQTELNALERYSYQNILVGRSILNNLDYPLYVSSDSPNWFSLDINVSDSSNKFSIYTNDFEIPGGDVNSILQVFDLGNTYFDSTSKINFTFEYQDGAAGNHAYLDIILFDEDMNCKYADVGSNFSNYGSGTWPMEVLCSISNSTINGMLECNNHGVEVDGLNQISFDLSTCGTSFNARYLGINLFSDSASVVSFYGNISNINLYNVSVVSNNQLPSLTVDYDNTLCYGRTKENPTGNSTLVINHTCSDLEGNTCYYSSDIITLEDQDYIRVEKFRYNDYTEGLDIKKIEDIDIFANTTIKCDTKVCYDFWKQLLGQSGLYLRKVDQYDAELLVYGYVSPVVIDISQPLNKFIDFSIDFNFYDNDYIQLKMNGLNDGNVYNFTINNSNDRTVVYFNSTLISNKSFDGESRLMFSHDLESNVLLVYGNSYTDNQTFNVAIDGLSSIFIECPICNYGIQEYWLTGKKVVTTFDWSTTFPNLFKINETYQDTVRIYYTDSVHLSSLEYNYVDVTYDLDSQYCLDIGFPYKDNNILKRSYGEFVGSFVSDLGLVDTLNSIFWLMYILLFLFGLILFKDLIWSLTVTSLFMCILAFLGFFGIQYFLTAGVIFILVIAKPITSIFM